MVEHHKCMTSKQAEAPPSIPFGCRAALTGRGNRSRDGEIHPPTPNGRSPFLSWWRGLEWYSASMDRYSRSLLTTLVLGTAIACGGQDAPETDAPSPAEPATSGDPAAAPEGAAEGEAPASLEAEGGGEAEAAEPAAPAPPDPHPETHLVNLLRIPGAVLATSSALHGEPNQALRLIDNDLETAWNSETGDVENAWIAFVVPEGARVERIEMTAGNTSQRNHRHYFTGNHRVAHLRVFHNGRPLRSQRFNYRDRGMQTVPVSGGPGEYQILLDQLIPGRHHAWREATVSELRVIGTAPDGVTEAAAPIVVTAEGVEPTVGDAPRVALGMIPDGRDEIWGLGAPYEELPKEYLLERIGAERRHRTERPEPPDFSAELGPDYHDERVWSLDSEAYDGVLEALRTELMDRVCSVPARDMRRYRHAYTRWETARLRLLRLLHRREHLAHRMHDPGAALPEGRALERMQHADERNLHRIEHVDERIPSGEERLNTAREHRDEMLAAVAAHSCPRYEGVLRDL